MKVGCRFIWVAPGQPSKIICRETTMLESLPPFAAMFATLVLSTFGQAPIGLSSSHPRVVLRHRPNGAEFGGIELHYFCLRGLGELPRLMLEITETPYDSVMYFDTKEYKAIAPFGQMPLLRDPDLDSDSGEDVYLAQSSSIVRYLAAKHDLDDMGLDDPAFAAWLDMVYEGSKDIAGKKSSLYLSDEEAKDSRDAQRLQMYLAKATELIEQPLKYAPGTNRPFFAGDSPSYADVAMFAALNDIEELVPGYLFKHRFEKLQAFVLAMQNIPALKNYLESPRRVPRTKNEVGKTPWSPDGYVFISDLQTETYASIYDGPSPQVHSGRRRLGSGSVEL